jgi:hypothetical protein
LAVTAICLGYVLPHASRRRVIDAEVPAEDRFSAHARVIEPPPEPAAAVRSSTALLPGTRVQRTELMQRPATSRPIKPARPIAAPAGAAPKGKGESAPPHAGKADRPDRRPVQDSPHGPAASEGAARLRASLLIAFALLTVAALVLAVTAGLTWWAPAVCAALAGGVLVAGRRAAVAAEARAGATTSRAAAARAASPAGSAVSASEPRSRQPGSGSRGTGAIARDGASASTKANERETRPAREGTESGSAETGTGRARRPAVAPRRTAQAFRLPQPLEITEVEPAEPVGAATDAESQAAPAPRRFTTARPKAVPDQGGEGDQSPTDGRGPRTRDAAAKGMPWTPAGVPAPTYTTVEGAPRWEPRPLTATDYAEARRAAAQATRRAAEEARAEGVETAATGQIKVPGRIIFAEAALDLDRAIAARRKAAGGS